MRPDQWQEIQALFLAAAARPAAEQAAFLDEACATDATLRDEVLALLAADRHSLENPFISDTVARAARALADAAGATRLGERVGPYRLLSELGHGGMGTVYLAERVDEQYQSRVAVKFVRGALAAPELARRLRIERQILADLTHPNIAWLLDGGTAADGTPYLVMEYVDGEAIDRWCERRGLGLAGRLALFRQVCAAVQHAHQALIVHRDLKPSNILVTTDGTPKLVDFGIAKLLEAKDAEATGTLALLTPAYAAPEQLRGGRIGVATDVYGLGGVLYRLLTGRTPIAVADATPAEVERRICAVPPVAPSAAATAAWRRALRGDLDTIVLKALRKEPERRYGSVEQLAEDLERHVTGLPVRARPDTWRYRAAKFLRRRRVGVLASAGLIVITAGYTVQLVRERNRAQIEAAKAARVADFIANVFRVSDPGEARGRSVTARELLDSGAARIQTELRDEPELQAHLMAVIGNVYRGLGLYPEATTQLEGALAIRRRIDGPDSPEVADLFDALAVLHRVDGNWVAADSFATNAVALLRRYRRSMDTTLAQAINNLAEVRRVRGDLSSADSLYREALAMRRKLLPSGDRALADNLNNLSLLLVSEGKYAAADSMQQEALVMRRRVLESNHWEIANSLHNLAWIRGYAGDYTGADSLHRQAIVLYQRLLGIDEPRTLSATSVYSETLYREGRLDAADSVVQEALRLARRRLGPDHPTVIFALRRLALITSARGLPDSALRVAHRAVELARRRLGPDHTSTLTATEVLGEVLAARRDFRAAAPLLRTTLARQRAAVGADHPILVRTLLALGTVERALGNTTAAEAALREAVTIGTDRLASTHDGLAGAQVALGQLLTETGRPGEALPLLTSGFDVLRQYPGPSAGIARAAAATLARIFETRGEADQAAHYRSAAAGVS